ncbi:MAG: hypothetical protein JSU00_11795 [Acidobacteria bacterium]|nr:hypothetical protein [Acidobacteriota bacterium]
MKRAVAFLLASWISANGADFAILNLKIVEGDGMKYAPGSRASRGITVEVTDETGRPVSGVAVSFQLPEDGPSGTFINGGRTEIVNTQTDGRASVWGMRWNKLTGAVSIRITAAKEGVRAGLIGTQYIDATAATQSARVSNGGHSKLLLITLVAAGVAGAGIAAGAMRGSKTPTGPTVTVLSVGTPTVIVGAP